MAQAWPHLVGRVEHVARVSIVDCSSLNPLCGWRAGDSPTWCGLGCRAVDCHGTLYHRHRLEPFRARRGSHAVIGQARRPSQCVGGCRNPAGAAADGRRTEAGRSHDYGTGPIYGPRDRCAGHAPQWVGGHQQCPDPFACAFVNGRRRLGRRRCDTCSAGDRGLP